MAEKHGKIVIKVADGRWIVRDSTEARPEVKASRDKALQQVRTRGEAARARLRQRPA